MESKHIGRKTGGPNGGLVLAGGGGHCLSVLDAALMTGLFPEIVITDPVLTPGTKVLGCPVIGTDEALPALRERGFCYVHISVGSLTDTALRRSVAEKAAGLGFQFPVIIDPSAAAAGDAVVGAGTFVGKHAVVNAGTVIGSHCIINTGSIVEHNCVVGDFSHISVGAVLCGGVRTGTDVFVGAGTTVIQEISMGDHVVIGANSTVLRNLRSGESVRGIVKKLHENEP